jgi:hypothetical protein
LLERAVQIVIVGDRAAPDTKALLRVIHNGAPPASVLNVVAAGAMLPAAHPAAGKGTIGGVATAYLCDGPVCSPPVTDPAALAAALARR